MFRQRTPLVLPIRQSGSDLGQSEKCPLNDKDVARVEVRSPFRNCESATGPLTGRSCGQQNRSVREACSRPSSTEGIPSGEREFAAPGQFQWLEFSAISLRRCAPTHARHTPKQIWCVEPTHVGIGFDPEIKTKTAARKLSTA